MWGLTKSKLYFTLAPLSSILLLTSTFKASIVFISRGISRRLSSVQATIPIVSESQYFLSISTNLRPSKALVYLIS